MCHGGLRNIRAVVSVDVPTIDKDVSRGEDQSLSHLDHALKRQGSAGVASLSLTHTHSSPSPIKGVMSVMMVGGWRGMTPYYSPPTAGHTPQRTFCTYTLTHTHSHAHTQEQKYTLFFAFYSTLIHSEIKYRVRLRAHTPPGLSLPPPSPFLQPQLVSPPHLKMSRKVCGWRPNEIGAAQIQNSAMHKVISMHTHTRTHQCWHATLKSNFLFVVILTHACTKSAGPPPLLSPY